VSTAPPLRAAPLQPNDGDAEFTAATTYHGHLGKGALVVLVVGIIAFALFVLAVLHYTKPAAPTPPAGEAEDGGGLPADENIAMDEI
jgi:hypothetical protein